jgi:DNA-binding CsgD family transcriptional regulator
MQAAGQSVLGRESELSELEGFLRSPPGPSALLLEGAAGIGKTTLWHAGAGLARGMGHRVLQCRAAESEARLSYAGLGDLLDVDLPPLPRPQQRALDAALLRADIEGAPPDQRAVSLAALGVLRGLVARAPVLVAIDDVQWLDAPSVKVLAFVVRRLETENIRFLVAQRDGTPLSDPLGLCRLGPALEVHRLHVGALEQEAMVRLLLDRSAGPLTRPTAIRLHHISGGNPFFALEIARALTATGVRAPPGEPLPVPSDLQALLGIRIAALSAAVLQSLLIVAAAGKAPEDIVLAAAAQRDRASAALGKAEAAGIVRRAHRQIAFTHPLLGSTVYAAASAEARVSTHRRLADLVDDPEERARHLALAATGPDVHVSRSLEESAAHARARGAPDAAAELAELATELTPPEDPTSTLRRGIMAAEHHFDAGDATRARSLMEEAIASARPGRRRAGALFHLASISWLDIPLVQTLAEQALEEAEGDAELLTSIHEHLAWVGIYRGDLSFATDHSRASFDHARSVTEPSVKSESMATFGMVEFLTGRQADEVMLEAVRLDDVGSVASRETPATVYTAARTCYGLQLLWAGRLDDSRDVLHSELARYERDGRYVVRDELHCYLADVECRAGNWDVALRHAQEAVEIGTESGHLGGRGQMLYPRALVQALRGEVEGARSDAREGLEISLRNEDLLSASCNRAVLGFLELSLNDPAAALMHLEPVLSFLEAMGAAEPGVIPCVPDAVEAFVAVGRWDEANSLTDRLERQGRSLGRPGASAAAARCRGLLAGSRGDASGARAALDQALVRNRQLALPFEEGRTLLVRGEVERRARQKRAARSYLEQAATIFEVLGARLWAGRARAELTRVGGATQVRGELTPTERRIALLVAEGKKNREVADALFISPKTVEANLSRIFHKLGVRSRTELSRRVTSGAGRPDL